MTREWNNNKVTKIFFDTEFTGLHKNTTLISIGFISDCGKVFYAELNDYDKDQVNNWIQSNVIDNLKFNYTNNEYKNSNNKVYLKCNKSKLKYELMLWFKQFKSVEIWSDCLAYDWILFNDIFGSAFDIPKNVYYIPFDICTLFKIKGIDPDISREQFIGINDNNNKHNALFDASVIKKCYERVINEYLEI